MIGNIPYYMILRQEAPVISVSNISSESYSDDKAICRQEYRATEKNSASVQYYSSNFDEADTKPWRNFIMNDEQTAFAKFSYGLNYMCTCNSMMSYTVSLDDNENKVNRPAD
jgi:hypothetical protein